MSAINALKTARDAGVQVFYEDGVLIMDAAEPPIEEIRTLLKQNRLGILALLRPGSDGWSAMDWRAFFEERAAILEFDADVPRSDAEAQALVSTVLEWLRHNPVSSMPGNCLLCGHGEIASKVLLPFGGEPAGHAWLHGECWPIWYAGRRATAFATLKAMGIPCTPEELTS